MRTGTPSQATARPVLNLTNVIHQTVCTGAAPMPEMWATSDWQRGFVSPADPALFAVPNDADCPVQGPGEAPHPIPWAPLRYTLGHARSYLWN